MADAVTSNVIYEDRFQYGIVLTGIGDGTGEAAVVKVDKSSIGVAADGAEAASLDFERIEWSVKPAASGIQLLWDHTTDDTAVILAGCGTMTFTAKPYGIGGEHPGLIGDGGRGGSLKDPRSAGGTGDILLTSPTTANTSYTITLWLYKNPD